MHAPRLWHDHVITPAPSLAELAPPSERQVHLLPARSWSSCWLSRFDVDDFLVGGNPGNAVFEEAFKQMENSYRWGKWAEGNFIFAGIHVRQNSDDSTVIDQSDYTDKWVEEIEISKARAYKKGKATASEVGQLHSAIGSAAWRASQTSPQYQADISLLLSEIPYATVETINKVNKLIREMKRTRQTLLFPSWKVPWSHLAVIVWADASNVNRPDKGSTMVIVAGNCPERHHAREEQPTAQIHWRSAKTPRQCFGSNGAEVQASTLGRDQRRAADAGAPGDCGRLEDHGSTGHGQPRHL